MKKLIIVLLLGFLIAGSVFAQWVYGYNPATQTLQTITGTLQMVNGVLAIVNSGNEVIYVANLQPYYGINGLYINTNVTVYGIITNKHYCEPLSFLVYGVWYNLPAYVYYYAPMPQPMYMPFQTPRAYAGYFNPWNSWSSWNSWNSWSSRNSWNSWSPWGLW
jgi:hypothetical protein